MSGEWVPGSGSGWGDSEPTERDETRGSGLWDFRMDERETRRIMFVSGEPVNVWEHEMFKITGKGGHREVCLQRNRLDDTCGVCESNHYPTFTGYFLIIDMGRIIERGDSYELEPYQGKEGKTYQFLRRKLGAKRGSKEKPGMLPTLAKLAKRYGGGTLEGTVWDVERAGELSPRIGDTYHFVEKIPKEQWPAYLAGLGAKDDAERLAPVDWREQFKPSTNEALRRMCQGHAAPSSGQQSSSSSGRSVPARRRDENDEKLPF